MPYAFTEQGVSMLSAVLRSDTAIQVSIQIMNAFVELRHTLASHASLIQRMDRFELKQTDHDQKFEKIFKALASGSTVPQQGVYFDGQTFDAYTFASDLIRQAKNSIQLIDNYVDDSVLLMLAKRNKGASATIYTRHITETLQLDLKKHNDQYPEIEVKKFGRSHDRFLILDEKYVYHLGASLKDLGKKWFAFTEISADAVNIINKINSL